MNMSNNPKYIKVGDALYRRADNTTLPAVDPAAPLETTPVETPKPIEDGRINATLEIVERSLKDLKKLSTQFQEGLLNKDATEATLDSMRKAQTVLEKQITILKALYGDYVTMHADKIVKGGDVQQ